MSKIVNSVLKLEKYGSEKTRNFGYFSLSGTNDKLVSKNDLYSTSGVRKVNQFALVQIILEIKFEDSPSVTIYNNLHFFHIRDEETIRKELS